MGVAPPQPVLGVRGALDYSWLNPMVPTRQVGGRDPPLLPDPDCADLARLDQSVDSAGRNAQVAGGLANSDQVLPHYGFPPFVTSSGSASGSLRRVPFTPGQPRLPWTLFDYADVHFIDRLI